MAYTATPPQNIRCVSWKKRYRFSMGKREGEGLDTTTNNKILHCM